jgi:hypothetical protein
MQKRVIYFRPFQDFGVNDDESQNPETRSDVETLKIEFFSVFIMKLAKST